MAQYKDKKRGTWYYDFKIKDRYTGEMVPYKKRGFPTKKAAREAEQQRRAIVQGVKGRIKMDTLILLYNESYGPGLKESTIVDDESYYRNHLKEYFDDYYIDEITSDMIEDWKRNRINARAPTKDGKYKPRTINKALSKLQKYLNFAVHKKYLTSNPCDGIKKVTNPEEIIEEQFTNYLELDDFEKLIQATDDKLWKDTFIFLKETGFRSGEYMALQWSKIDFEKRKIYVHKNLTYKSLTPGRKITTPKNKRSIRGIDMQDILFSLLKERFEVEQRKDGFNMDWFVFGGPRPITKSTLERRLNTYIKKANIRKITPHGFRHTHATELIASGINDVLIAERLGHTVTELHRTYAHVYQSMRVDMLDYLNNRNIKKTLEN